MNKMKPKNVEEEKNAERIKDKWTKKTGIDANQPKKSKWKQEKTRGKGQERDK